MEVLSVSEIWYFDLNPDFAVAFYCGLKNLAAALVSQFWSST
jgi:hypothetical protein